jgi:hypothetical protein
MKLIITRENSSGGGEDRISLATLLSDMGLLGNYVVSAIDDSGIDVNESDDIMDGELIHEYTITVEKAPPHKTEVLWDAEHQQYLEWC